MPRAQRRVRQECAHLVSARPLSFAHLEGWTSIPWPGPCLRRPGGAGRRCSGRSVLGQSFACLTAATDGWPLAAGLRDPGLARAPGASGRGGGRRHPHRPALACRRDHRPGQGADRGAAAPAGRCRRGPGRLPVSVVRAQPASEPACRRWEPTALGHTAATEMPAKSANQLGEPDAGGVERPGQRIVF